MDDLIKIKMETISIDLSKQSINYV